MSRQSYAFCAKPPWFWHTVNTCKPYIVLSETSEFSDYSDCSDCSETSDCCRLAYFSRMKTLMGVPSKSHFSRILFSR